MGVAVKIAVYGAGAIGGLIAARLALAGCDISVVARGTTLTALQQHGLRLETDEKVVGIPVRAVQSPQELGVQDIVVLAVKSPALSQVAAQIAPLLGPSTSVITAMNGIPWWFFQGRDVRYHGIRLQALDPDGNLAIAIPVRHVVGCVVHLSSACSAPGLVRLGFGNRLILGEPDGRMSERLAAIVGLLRQASFDAEASAAIRTDIWYKLWGNMTMNPVSALTGATSDKILDDPLVRRFCLDVMYEAAAIGAEIGCPIVQSGEERMEVARKLGSFKTSMLQDAEAGKALEIDALVTVVHEIGKLVGIATPNIDCLLGLVRLFGQTRGIYQ
jgi:2-dehydropantoate 2-reductase